MRSKWAAFDQKHSVLRTANNLFASAIRLLDREFSCIASVFIFSARRSKDCSVAMLAEFPIGLENRAFSIRSSNSLGALSPRYADVFSREDRKHFRKV